MSLKIVSYPIFAKVDEKEEGEELSFLSEEEFKFIFVFVSFFKINLIKGGNYY